jgi:hypothetical protein
VQHVEHLKHHGLSVSSAAREMPAEPREVWPSVVAQANQLAIERHPTLAQHLSDRHELRKIIRALATVARPERNRSAVVAKLRAAAIPLHLKGPTDPGRHPPRGEQHRRDEDRLLFRMAHDSRAYPAPTDSRRC